MAMYRQCCPIIPTSNLCVCLSSETGCCRDLSIRNYNLALQGIELDARSILWGPIRHNILQQSEALEGEITMLMLIRCEPSTAHLLNPSGSPEYLSDDHTPAGRQWTLTRGDLLRETHLTAYANCFLDPKPRLVTQYSPRLFSTTIPCATSIEYAPAA